MEGKTNAEVLEAVAVKFPTAKTSKGCVAYYRTKLAAAAKAAAAPAPKCWLMRTLPKKPRSNRPLPVTSRHFGACFTLELK